MKIPSLWEAAFRTALNCRISCKSESFIFMCGRVAPFCGSWHQRLIFCSDTRHRPQRIQSQHPRLFAGDVKEADYDHDVVVLALREDRVGSAPPLQRGAGPLRTMSVSSPSELFMERSCGCWCLSHWTGPYTSRVIATRTTQACSAAWTLPSQIPQEIERRLAGGRTEPHLGAARDENLEHRRPFGGRRQVPRRVAGGGVDAVDINARSGKRCDYLRPLLAARLQAALPAPGRAC